MKKITSFFALFFVVCCHAFSQSTQNCIVKEYNDAKKKNPLAGVEIVVNNAGSNVSAKNGKFVLAFRTLKPGDKVEVRKIEKDGYEIFNKDALDAWRIANDGSEFTIVLCKSAKFKALKDQYNAVASKSYAQQQKKDEQRLASLLKQGKLQQAEYEKKLKELKDKYDEQLENLDNYIDRFARIDLETISKEEQKIIEMVKEGKIEEAIAAYEAMNLEEKYAQAVENIGIATDAISQLEKVKADNERARKEAFAAVKRMNDARRLQGGEENYIKIYNTYGMLITTDSLNFGLNIEYIDFLIGQNKLEEAEKNINRMLTQNLSLDDICMLTTTKVGIAYRKNYGFEEVLQELYGIEEKSRTSFLSNINKLNLYGNLGGVLIRIHDFIDAEIYYDKVDSILNTIGEYNNERIIDLYATHYNNKSLMFRYCGNIERALECNVLSVDMYKKLMEIDKEKYGRDYLEVANNLILLYQIQKSPKGDSLLIKTDSLSRELAKLNPSKYIPVLINTMIRIQTLYTSLKEYKKALKYSIEAEKFIRERYKEDPIRYKEHIYVLSNNNAICYAYTSDFQKAIREIDRALSLEYDDMNAMDTKGEIMLIMGDDNRALEVWTEIKSRFPESYSQLKEFSTLYLTLKDKGLISE